MDILRAEAMWWCGAARAVRRGAVRCGARLPKDVGDEHDGELGVRWPMNWPQRIRDRVDRVALVARLARTNGLGGAGVRMGLTCRWGGVGVVRWGGDSVGTVRDARFGRHHGTGSFHVGLGVGAGLCAMLARAEIVASFLTLVGSPRLVMGTYFMPSSNPSRSKVIWSHSRTGSLE